MPTEGLEAFSAALLIPPHLTQRKKSSPKRIRRLEDAGYTFKLDTDFLWKDSGAWLVSVPGAALEDFIVRLVVDISQGMITIHDAWNKDKDPVKTLKLRDMIMSVWKFKADQDIATLKWIKYEGVVETHTMTALSEIYKKISNEAGDDVFIPSSGGGHQMRKAYCQLMLNSVFTIGARKMTREYSELRGRSIDGLVISNCERGEFPDLLIYIGNS